MGSPTVPKTLREERSYPAKNEPKSRVGFTFEWLFAEFHQSADRGGSSVKMSQFVFFD